MVTEEKLEQKRAQKQKQAKDAEELLSDLDSHDDGSDYSSDKDGGIDDEEEEDNHKESHVAEEEDVKPRAKSKKNKGKEANVLVMKTWNLKRMRLSSLVPVATKPTKVPRIESSSYSTQTSTSNPTKTKNAMELAQWLMRKHNLSQALLLLEHQEKNQKEQTGEDKILKGGIVKVLIFNLNTGKAAQYAR